MIHQIVNGVAIPNRDSHFREYINKRGMRYQKAQYNATMRYVKNRRLAIDVGAHIGLFSMYMAEDFDQVRGFEAVVENYDCCVYNMSTHYPNVDYKCHNVAVSHSSDPVTIGIPTEDNSGSWEVGNTGVEYQAVTIDSLVEQSWQVDFIKMDIQGYEANVLRGLSQTLTDHHPVMLVETMLNGVINTKVYEELSKYGYKIAQKVGKDTIYT